MCVYFIANQRNSFNTFFRNVLEIKYAVKCLCNCVDNIGLIIIKLNEMRLIVNNCSQ